LKWSRGRDLFDNAVEELENSLVRIVWRVRDRGDKGIKAHYHDARALGRIKSKDRRLKWKCFSSIATGKTRYGICVNFYRPVERAGGNGATGIGFRRDKQNTNFRRESWRKSMEKSSDSAFSRYAIFSLSLPILQPPIADCK
jgi:hypothetical protein